MGGCEKLWQVDDNEGVGFLYNDKVSYYGDPLCGLCVSVSVCLLHFFVTLLADSTTMQIMIAARMIDWYMSTHWSSVNSHVCSYTERNVGCIYDH